MKRARFITRLVFLLLTALLVMNITRKTDEHQETVLEFKIKTLNKIQADTLGSKHQMNETLKDTTGFIDQSPHVREGLRYLVGWLGLFVVVELGFYILMKRKSKVEI